MRIVLIGQQAFGRAVLDAILDAGDDQVAGVFCAPDQAGRPDDPLKTGAEARGVPVFQPGRLRAEAAVNEFKALAPDLCVMAYVTDIVPMAMIEAPPSGTIQYHPSLLPRHRGPSSINWPIIQGDTRTGLTVFWPDEGLDTGPVLLQKEVEIGPDDTVGSLYFNHLSPLGVDAMMESIALVRAGKAPRVAQGESEATYESWCRREDARIDWTRPAAEVHNLIRGCDPQPGAHTTAAGAPLSVFDAARVDGDPGEPPGTVLAVDESGLTVAAGGGAVRVGRVRPPSSGKIPAAEYASAAGLRVGDCLE